MKMKIKTFSFTLLLLIIVLASFETAIRIIPPPSLRIFLNHLEFRHNINEHDTEGFTILDSDTGYKHAPNIDWVIKKPEHRIKTNSLGFRGIEPTPKKQGEFRIMVTGDSFTEGWGEESSEIFSSKLQILLNNRNDGTNYLVYNFGIYGYGTREESKTVIKYFNLIQPDLVILVFYAGNDFNDNIQKYYIDGNRVRFRSPEQLKREKSILYSSRLYIYMELKFNAVLQRLQYKNALENTKKYISELDDFTDGKGIKSLFVFTDTKFVPESRITEAINSMLGMPPRHKRKEIIRDHCKSINLRFIDMQDRITSAFPDPVLLYDKRHGHWNPAGHQYVANVLYWYMIENLLLKSP